MAAPRPRRARFALVAVAALALCAVAAHERGGAHADVVAAGRETVDIGDRVTAVLERGARVRFDVEPRPLRPERVVVDQLAGRVAYRVAGAGVRFHTPAGGFVAHDARFIVDLDRAPGHVRVGAGDVSVSAAAELSVERAPLETPPGPGDLEARLTALRALRERLRRGDDDDGARFTRAHLKAAVAAALEEAGVRGAVTGVDCGRSPCVVTGVISGSGTSVVAGVDPGVAGVDPGVGTSDAGGAALASKLLHSAALAPYADDDARVSTWRDAGGAGFAVSFARAGPEGGSGP